MTRKVHSGCLKPTRRTDCGLVGEQHEITFRHAGESHLTFYRRVTCKRCLEVLC